MGMRNKPAQMREELDPPTYYMDKMRVEKLGAGIVAARIYAVKLGVLCLQCTLIMESDVAQSNVEVTTTLLTQTMIDLN